MVAIIDLEKTMKRIAMAALISAGFNFTTYASPFSEIRIGDEDGFGFNADANFATLSGDGGLADRNNDDSLGPGDVLPSLNGGGKVARGNGDDFDNRLGESINGTGFTDNGSIGEEFTDIALSTSYDQSSLAGNTYNANTSTFGSGGVFPSAPSGSLSNQPGFIFDFFVADGDILAGTDIFFNMVFGDYDVTPANIEFTYAAAPEDIIGITPQNNGPDDGLIQGAFATLSFADIFTYNGVDGYDGYVEVDFRANNEPYTAFDYVELSVTPLQVNVPSPGTLSLFFAGLVGLGLVRRRKA